MRRNALLGLSYRRHHVLEVGTARWDIQAEWQLRGKAAPPSPDNRIRFSLELSSLDPGWQAAIARARALEPATIDGIPAHLELRTVELHFATFADQTEPYGEAKFSAVVDQVIPFPRSLEDAELASALAEAGNIAGDLRIQADEIEVTDRYWIFPIQNIGANGVIVDRTNGHPFLTSGSLDRSTWIWTYEHRLLDEPAGDIVVDRIVDHERAFTALCRFARVRREDMQTLPLILEACATWMAAAALKEAETALTWRVAPRVG